jgi:parallel beta-helix repeat protein
MDQLQTRLDALAQQRPPVSRRRHRCRAPMTRPSWGGARLWTIGLIVGWMTAAAGQTFQCGATLGPGGVFRLEADVICGEDDPPIALTVRDGARLDLGGHIAVAESIAVLLEGRGAVLHNGRAWSFILAAVSVAGDGGHTVRGIEAAGDPANGIHVLSDRNRVLGNAGVGSDLGLQVDGNHNLVVGNTGLGQGAVRVTGHHNLLLKNESIEDQRLGFLIEGDHNLLVGNQGRGVGERGFEVRGNGNTLVGNLIKGAETGIVVQGADNRLVRNTALENGVDLLDAHEECDGNVWRQNVFQTSQAGDTATPACIR